MFRNQREENRAPLLAGDRHVQRRRDILGVPIEELLFAAAEGAIWSVAYEYVFGYRLETAGRI